MEMRLMSYIEFGGKVFFSLLIHFTSHEAKQKEKKYIRKFILHQKVFDFVFEVVSGPMDGDGLVFSRFDCSTCTNSHCLGFLLLFVLFIREKKGNGLCKLQ